MEGCSPFVRVPFVCEAPFTATGAIVWVEATWQWKRSQFNTRSRSAIEASRFHAAAARFPKLTRPPRRRVCMVRDLIMDVTKN